MNMETLHQPSGLLLINKPAGISSAACLRLIKQQPFARHWKLGHAGTLDPVANGLLLVLVNRATRLFDLLQTYQKKYHAQILLHLATNTGDITGTVTAKQPAILLSQQQINLVFNRYQQVYSYFQRVPDYAAVRFQGKKFYQYIRAGIKPPPRFKSVTIYQLHWMRYQADQALLDFTAVVSKGFYVRMFIQELCQQLGVLGTMQHLTRIFIGPFQLSQAVLPTAVTSRHLLSLRQIFGALNMILVPIPEQFKLLLFNGHQIPFTYCATQVVFYDPDSTVMGWYRWSKKYYVCVINFRD